MKKTIFMMFLLLPVLTFAQRNSASVKLGLFDPSATDGGFILGYEGGRFIDENLEIGWSIDWFNKNYVDESLVREYDAFDQFGVGTLNELRAKTNLHSVPIMFTMRGNFPFSPNARVYVTGGVGLEMLLVWYRDYNNPEDDEVKGAFDFAWRLGAGVSYDFGKRSEVFGELAYHSSEPSWTFTVSDAGSTRTFERKFDMSGMMARVGVRFYF